jgi:hypothetical protein
MLMSLFKIQRNPLLVVINNETDKKLPLYFVGQVSDLRPTNIGRGDISSIKLFINDFRLNKKYCFLCKSDGQTKVGLFSADLRRAISIISHNTLKNNAFMFCSQGCEVCGSATRKVA